MLEPNHIPNPDEDKPVSEYEKIKNFSIIVAGSTILGIVLLLTRPPKVWMFAFFFPTVIWFILIFFVYFERFLDWLKVYLDNRKNNQK